MFDTDRMNGILFTMSACIIQLSRSTLRPTGSYRDPKNVKTAFQHSEIFAWGSFVWMAARIKGITSGVSAKNMIHPTAVIDPKAELHPSVVIGPYSVIDGDVKIGEGCRLGPHVYITGHSTIGARNKFYPGAVIGEAPQDLAYKGAPTQLRIGDDNTFREAVTVNRSTKEGTETVIGSRNLLMACTHVAHDCRLGNNIIMANGAVLGGYVEVGDRAVISATCLVHQFIRIGTLAMMRGGAAISKDLPPFLVALRENSICGLNIIGLRRAGFSSEERMELKRAYKMVFRANLPVRKAVEAARQQFTGQHAVRMLDFIASSTRGVCTHSGVENEEEND
jgi:UDP-N-acetylglucosamine acyltransferase